MGGVARKFVEFLARQKADLHANLAAVLDYPPQADVLAFGGNADPLKGAAAGLQRLGDGVDSVENIHGKNRNQSCNNLTIGATLVYPVPGGPSVPPDARLKKLGGISLNRVYIVSAVRTPIGKFGGALASQSAADMGVVAAKAAMERAGIQPSQVEETIFGNARQAGGGPNPARQISIRSGVPQEVPAYTVNKACASGIKSIALGFQEIATGNLECVLAGGAESMSRVPFYLDGARFGYRMGHQEVVDGMYRDGFFCPMAKMVMGETAELLAEQYKISRDQQDQFALTSQQRAAAAQSGGRFDAEIAPVTIEGKKGSTTFSRDEHLFPDATMEKLAKLAPVFGVVFIQVMVVAKSLASGQQGNRRQQCHQRGHQRKQRTILHPPHTHK